MTPVPSRVLRNFLATLAPAEKEDAATEALVRPEPKKKPPRTDLRKQRVDSESDPDLGADLGSNDPDLSMNYKRVAAAFLRLADPEHKPGEFWKTTEGWRALNPKGTPKSFEDEDAAKSFAHSESDPEKSEEPEEGSKPQETSEDSGAGRYPVPPPSLDQSLRDVFGGLGEEFANPDSQREIAEKVREITNSLGEDREKVDRAVAEEFRAFSDRGRALLERKDYATLLASLPYGREADRGAGKFIAAREGLDRARKAVSGPDAEAKKAEDRFQKLSSVRKEKLNAAEKNLSELSKALGPVREELSAAKADRERIENEVSALWDRRTEGFLGGMIDAEDDGLDEKIRELEKVLPAAKKREGDAKKKFSAGQEKVEKVRAYLDTLEEKDSAAEKDHEEALSEIRKKKEPLVAALGEAEKNLAAVGAGHVLTETVVLALSDPRAGCPDSSTRRPHPADVRDNAENLYRSLPPEVAAERLKRSEGELAKIRSTLGDGSPVPSTVTPFRGSGEDRALLEAQRDYYVEEIKAGKLVRILASDEEDPPKKPGKGRDPAAPLISRLVHKLHPRVGSSDELFEIAGGAGSEKFRASVHTALSQLDDDEYLDLVEDFLPPRAKSLVEVLREGTYSNPERGGEEVPLTPETRSALRASLTNALLNESEAFEGLDDDSDEESGASGGNSSAQKTETSKKKKKENPSPKGGPNPDEGALSGLSEYHPGEVSIEDILGRKPSYDVDESVLEELSRRTASGVDSPIARGFGRTNPSFSPLSPLSSRSTRMSKKTPPTPSSRKATEGGARRFMDHLDTLASTVQYHHASLGLPSEIAIDFARRCDMIADRVASLRTAGYFDPSTIAVETKGPLVSDSNNPFMKGHFTQEGFDALSTKQEKGQLAGNAAAGRADPKLAALRAASAALAAVVRLAEEEAPAEEEKDEKAADGSEDSEKTASAAKMGLFA